MPPVTARVPIDRMRGFNAVPSSLIMGGWMAPLAIFWVLAFADHDAAPSLPSFASLLLGCYSPLLLPGAYYRTHAFERDGRLYEWFGVRWFRIVVPHGDLANRIERRRRPGFRMVRCRRTVAAYVNYTVNGERGHLILLVMGGVSAYYASLVDWRWWSWYLVTVNIPANVYPILLQRYTRARIARLGLAAQM